MKNKYKHIFFDLDHTLWDFERNSSEALQEMYLHFELDNLSENLNFTTFLETFHRINYQLWAKYDRNEIDQLELRYSRFKLVLGEFGIPEKNIPFKELAESYLELMPQKPHLMPFAKEVLDYLRSKYQMHILTNGFAEIQSIKMNAAQIHHYFDHIITSANSGHKKPSKQIFEYALQLAQAHRHESIMIGDNLQTDIEGAKNAQIDHIFFNTTKAPHQSEIQIEITCLSELKELL